MKFLITVPCRPDYPWFFTRNWARWESWTHDFEEETGHRIRVIPENTPNRLDISLSKCIMMAKELRPAWWIRLDGDIYPETPFRETFVRALELWEEKEAILGAPTIDRHGVCQWKALHPPTPPAEKGPFEVEFVSGSLVFTPQDVYDRLKPVSQLSRNIGQDAIGFEMYVDVQKPNTTEDYDYCQRVRALGYHVYADPFTEVRQMRPDFGVPSYRRGMKVNEPVEIPVQGVGVA
jgi:hypothetical protein